jgi:MFS transporter, AAHS family, 4-hydroxybenzoate transporter
MQRNLDLSEQLDRQPVGPLLVMVVALCTLVTLADGYNISAAGFAAPGIVKAWHLSRASLGPLFSSSLVAGLLGPSFFGAISLRIGRRNAIVIATLLFGVAGVICGLCNSLIPLVASRFVAGVGMSGALAVTVASINEFSPRRLRATLVTVVFSGTTFGSGVIGFIAPPLVARFGWPSVFIAGGVAPILIAGLVYWLMPESPKFLCLAPRRHAELGALMRRLNPRADIPPESTFFLSDEVNPPKLSYRPFFVGPLALLTPLLWLGSFLGQIVFHSFNNWLPTLLTDAGLPYSDASSAIVLFQFAGTLGGWIIMRPLDRYGMWPCTLLYLLSLPVVASLGAPMNNEALFMVLVSLAGFCVLGLHFAQVFCVSSVYPTSIRPLGIGMFMIFARAGGAVGPLVVGIMLGNKISIKGLFLWGTLPLAIGLVASLAVTLIYRRYYHKGGDAAGAALTSAAQLDSGSTLKARIP